MCGITYPETRRKEAAGIKRGERKAEEDPLVTSLVDRIMM